MHVVRDVLRHVLMHVVRDVLRHVFMPVFRHAFRHVRRHVHRHVPQQNVLCSNAQACAIEMYLDGWRMYRHVYGHVPQRHRLAEELTDVEAARLQADDEAMSALAKLSEQAVELAAAYAAKSQADDEAIPCAWEMCTCTDMCIDMSIENMYRRCVVTCIDMCIDMCVESLRKVLCIPTRHGHGHVPQRDRLTEKLADLQAAKARADNEARRARAKVSEQADELAAAYAAKSQADDEAIDTCMGTRRGMCSHAYMCIGDARARPDLRAGLTSTPTGRRAC